LKPKTTEEPLEQWDPYGVYGGRWHDECWEKFGYGNYKFDESFAGEHLEEDW
jgi:hypothetical protein